MDCLKSVQIPFRHGKSVRAISTTGFRVVERLYGPDLQVPLHLHASAHLVITLRGKYINRANGRNLELSPWTVGFYPAGEQHSSSYSELGARALHIDITQKRLEIMREACPALSDRLIFRGEKSTFISGEICRELCMLDDSVSPIVLEGLILQLFGEISRVPMQKFCQCPGWLSRADAMIRARFTEQLTLSDIASQAGVHPVHLAREYRKYYQSTVGEQIRRLRIDYARQQISTTENTLANIALTSGFSDQSHFTVAFKSYVGSPPSVYRRTLRLSGKDRVASSDSSGSSDLVFDCRFF
jgi:AraC family transcriptional regulator